MSTKRMLSRLLMLALLAFSACESVDHRTGVVEFNLKYSVGRGISDSKFGNFVRNMPHLFVDTKTYAVEGGFENGCLFKIFVDLETDIVVGWEYASDFAKMKCDEIQGHAGGQ